MDFAALKKKFDTGEVTSGDIFGTREYLKNNYLYRMAGDVIGIFGNSKEEAMYPFYGVDADGNPLDGTTNKYTLHFAEGELPPVIAFWSLTMYDREGFFVPNPLDRVDLSQRSKLNFKNDGSLDLYIQKDSPGKDEEANWLPSAEGDFGLILRLYWPNEKAPSILDGSWMPPPVRAVK